MNSSTNCQLIPSGAQTPTSTSLYVLPHLRGSHGSSGEHRVAMPQKSILLPQRDSSSSAKDTKPLKPWEKKKITVEEKVQTPSDTENDRRISGIISKVKTIRALVLFCNNPTLDNLSVSLNAIHYAMIFKRIEKLLQFQPIEIDKKNKINEGDRNWNDVQEITNIMIRNLKGCPIGQSSQIVSSLCNLKYRNPDMEVWALEQVISKIPQVRDKELFMLLRGAIKIFSSKGLSKIAEALQLKYKWNTTEQFQSMQPNLLGVIAVVFFRSYEHLSYSAQLVDSLCSTIKEKISEFQDKELLYLLNKGNFLNRDSSLCLIQSIDSELMTEGRNLSSDETVSALKGFAKNNYISKFSEKRFPYLDNQSETKISDRISVIYSTSLVIPNIKDKFDDLVGFLISENEISEEWDRLYIQDKIMFLATAAIYYNAESCPEKIRKMAVKVSKQSFGSVLDEELNNLKDLLFVLGVATANIPMAENISYGLTLTTFKDEVIKELVKAIANDSSLNVLEVMPKCVTANHRTADIVIRGFEKLGLDQKPIAIEIDSDRCHKKIDGSEGILGRDIIRNKIHERAGFDVMNIRIASDAQTAVSEIMVRLKKKTGIQTSPIKELISEEQDVEIESLHEVLRERRGLSVTQPAICVDTTERRGICGDISPKTVFAVTFLVFSALAMLNMQFRSGQ